MLEILNCTRRAYTICNTENTNWSIHDVLPFTDVAGIDSRLGMHCVDMVLQIVLGRQQDTTKQALKLLLTLKHRFKCVRAVMT